MKKLFFVFATLAICLFLSSCAAYVKLDKDSGGIKIDHAGGYASPERGLRILEEQTYVQERQELLTVRKKLYQKLAKAIDSSDEKEIIKTQKMIEVMNNDFSASAVKCRYLGIRNSDPNHAIRIKNGPFEGQYLNPGEKTHTKRPFPVGVFSLEYEWYRVGTSSSGTNTIHISIGEYRTEDIIFKQWDD